MTFGWICCNIPDATSRVVLIARAFMDMAGSDDVLLLPRSGTVSG